MPLELIDIPGLQEYLTGVVKRADHHGDNVRYVVLPLVGAIILFKNHDQSIKVFTRKGNTGNVLWVHIGSSQYVVSYDHVSKSIVIKRGTTHGKILARFTNATSIPEILSIFEGLEPSN